MSVPTPCPLREAARRFPDRPALWCIREAIRYRELDRWAETIADSFRQNPELAEGDLLGLRAAASPAWIALMWGAFRAGLTLCPLNPRWPPRMLGTQLRLLQPRLVVQDEESPLRDAGWQRSMLLSQAPSTSPRADSPSPMILPTGPATLLYTSGSSGLPRPVVHTLTQHLASALAANAQSGLGEDEVWLLNLPLCHVGGLAILFRCCLAGAAVALPAAGDSLEASILRDRPSRLSLVPTQLIRLLRSGKFPGSLPGVKRILLGGAPMPDGLLQSCESRGWPVAVSYGMTETASQVTATPPGASPKGAGFPLPHAEIHIHSTGEIWVRASSLCLGRWEAGEIHPLTDSAGWLHSGDRGRLEGNLLIVEGRMDRQFISGGENIQPEAVERALMDLPGLSQAVVVPLADAEFGMRPAAWVDADCDAGTIAEWNRQLRGELPAWMIPVRYRRLPPVSGMKPDLAQLTREMAEGKAPAGSGQDFFSRL